MLFTAAALQRALQSIAYGAELDYSNKITTICSLSTMQGYNLKDYSPMKLTAASLDDDGYTSGDRGDFTQALAAIAPVFV